METTTRLTVQQEQMIRTRKGAEIATKQRITKRGPVWVVPSQTHGLRRRKRRVEFLLHLPRP